MRKKASILSVLTVAIAALGFAEAPYEVVMAYPVFSNQVNDIAQIQEGINKLSIPKINASVKLVPMGISQYNNQLNLVLSGTEKWDLVVSGNMLGIAGVISRKQILPLDDLVAKSGQGILKAYDKLVLDACRIKEGKLYGVPPMKNFANAYGLVMRKDIVDKYKIDVAKIKTLDDVERVLKLVKKNEPSLIGLLPPSVNSSPLNLGVYPVVDTLGGNGAVLMNRGASLKVENWYASSQYKALVKRMRSWYLAGYTMKDPVANRDDPTIFMRGNKAFSYLGTIKPGSEMQEYLKCGQEVVIAEIEPPFATSTMTNGWLWCVPRSCKDPEAAVRMLDFLCTDPAASTLLVYGIEGRHWVKRPDGFADFPAGIDQDNSPYYPNASWLMPNSLIAVPWKGYPAKLDQVNDAYYQKAIKSKAMGFVFDPTPVKAQISAVANVIEQFDLGLGSGTLDPETVLPQFLAKLGKAGIDKIIAEKQAQLDAWAKANGKN